MPPRIGPAELLVFLALLLAFVLLVSCKFCQKLTPVDLSACAECGAKL